MKGDKYAVRVGNVPFARQQELERLYADGSKRFVVEIAEGEANDVERIETIIQEIVQFCGYPAYDENCEGCPYSNYTHICPFNRTNLLAFKQYVIGRRDALELAKAMCPPDKKSPNTTDTHSNLKQPEGNKE